MNKHQQGCGVITVERRNDGSTVASQLLASYPIRLHLTGRINENHNHSISKALTCYILGYGGGLVSGDEIRLSINVKNGASLVLTSQSTSKSFKAIPSRQETVVMTCAYIQKNALLFLAPQPTQCFSHSKLRQETHIVLDDVPDTSIDLSPSLVLVDWFTGGRLGMDDGPWSFDMYSAQINISYTQTHFQSMDHIDSLPSQSQAFFRDTTILSGGDALLQHMRQYNVVCTLLLIGPQTDEVATTVLKKFSSRHLYDDQFNSSSSSIHHDMNVGEGLNNNGLLVSCGTFHRVIYGKIRHGTILRVAATSIEIAARFLSENIGNLNDQLKEDPFMEILTLRHSLQGETSIDSFTRPNDSPTLLGLLKNSPRSKQDDESFPPQTMDASNISKLLLYQLTDASLPTGAFAHSFTIEVASQLRIITSREGSFKHDICQHIWEVILQTFTTSAPFLMAACQVFTKTHQSQVEHLNWIVSSFADLANEWEKIDLEQSITITSHVAGRASSLQGSGMLRAFSSAFPHLSAMIKELRRRIFVGSSDERIYRGHAATCFGAIAGILGLDTNTAISIFLYTTCRDMVNAAVRMNLIGPLEGGNVTYLIGGRIENLIHVNLKTAGKFKTNWHHPPKIIAFQIAPLIDILSNAHDRLYTRLFNS